MKEFLGTITPLQWLGIVILFNGTIVGGTAALTQMGLPPVVVQALSAFCGLANVFLGGLVTMFGGQAAMVKGVQAMPGVSRIAINENANATLAQLATDPAQSKVGATTPEVRAVLQEKAGG